MIAIEPAAADDAAQIERLLREAGLPHEDFAPHLPHFLVARQDGAVIGAIGAEVGGTDALLRSLVVAPAGRGRGLGDALLRQLEERAAQWRVQRWWLLTTTAEAFFLQRGFQRMLRSEAPAAIANTKEFRELCPSLAACLSRERRSA